MPDAVFDESRIKDLEDKIKQLQKRIDEQEEEHKKSAAFFSRIALNTKIKIIEIMEAIATAGTNVDDEQKVIDVINNINSSCRGLLENMDDVVEITAFEGDCYVPEAEVFNLASQLQYVINCIRMEGKNQGKRVTIDRVDLVHEEVIGDTHRLNKVLWNEAIHFLKYIPPKGTLTIGIAELPGESSQKAEYRISFQGNCEQFDKERLEGAKLPLHTSSIDKEQLDELLRVLAVRKVVKCIDGYVKPIVCTQGTWRIDIGFFLELQKKAPREFHALRGKKILVVDDEPVSCNCCRMVIVGLGLECDCVNSGEKALKLLEKEDYYAAIVDWHIPQSDGVCVTSEIRRRQIKIPIILMSEQNWERVEYQARNAGVSAFLLKPLFPTELATCLQQFAGEPTDL